MSSVFERSFALRFHRFAPMVVMAFVTAVPSASAQSWQVRVGAQSANQGHQALAFLPNEIWIHAGDTVQWTFDAAEIHTVTFMTPGQVRPPFQAGCPGVSPSGSPFDNSACVTSAPSVTGQTFSVNFPVAGNFKVVCLVHASMTGVVHVLNPSVPLPHDQAFYDRQAKYESGVLINDTQVQSELRNAGPRSVVAGVGEITATPGGQSTLSVMRFMDETKVVHVGDTVEWGNQDPTTPHTITFGGGPDPAVPPAPSPNVVPDADGALHVWLSAPTDVAHSGFIVAASQEKTGSPLRPLTFTRFRATFTNAGVYNYKCILHDDMGMVGKVIVLP